jgi:hypothetical protein
MCTLVSFKREDIGWWLKDAHAVTNATELLHCLGSNSQNSKYDKNTKSNHVSAQILHSSNQKQSGFIRTIFFFQNRCQEYIKPQCLDSVSGVARRTYAVPIDTYRPLEGLQILHIQGQHSKTWAWPWGWRYCGPSKLQQMFNN